MTGNNFGFNAAPIFLQIGSTECSAPSQFLPHTSITCNLAPLSALPSIGLTVRVTISNQTGSASFFSYNVPSIDTISNTRPTSGGIRVTCRLY